ncbi:MAG: ABC transporter substrate-binding protein, partial [Pseudomonadota bacterium]
LQAQRFDRDEGFRLEIVPLAGRAATTIAFQAADVDLIVADWIWAMRQRGQGADLRFFPYSRALGAVMVREGGPATPCDLKGRPVGVVGGPVDKGWLVLQAYIAQICGFALADETQTLFGAPPLMSRQLDTGTVDAVATYWHYAARLEAQGARRLIGVAEALTLMEMADPPALIGFVWDAGRIQSSRIEALRRAIARASAVLQSSDPEWERLRPLMRVGSDAEFTRLRDTYRAGIQTDWRLADTEAATRLFRLMEEAGGQRFLESAGAFDPAVFPTDG